jgi:thioredoxin-dependent peroxiredoxin
MSKRNLPILLLVAVAAMSAPAWAALKPGAKAPMFTAEATLGGKRFTFSLEDALKSGPVVVYFYPKAFTSGCTIEAHEFAEAMEEFKALGARVIGVSGDDLETLDKFSTLECGGKFPVASDEDKQIMGAYDSVMLGVLPYANRTSYVVAPDGTVAYEYTALSPHDHVKNTLAAIKALKAKPAPAAAP